MKIKLILVLVLVLVIGLGGYAFYYYSQPSSRALSEEFKEKAASDLLGRKAQLTDETPTGNVTFEGKTISFEYPAKAILYKYRETSSSTESTALDDMSFDIKEPKLVFNLRVAPSTITVLEEYPGVRLRNDRSYEYRKTSRKIDDVTGLVYTKSSNGHEKTGFFLKSGNIYSFSVTGASQIEVEKLFKLVLTSAKFNSSHNSSQNN